MSREIRISRGIGEGRAVLLDKGRLEGVILEICDRPYAIDAIYAGRIVEIHPGLDAAFVDLGGETGFLPLREAKKLHPGEMTLVQVVRAADGGKLARLTRAIELPGLAMVYRPTMGGTAMSRKITTFGVRGWLQGWGDKWGGHVLFRSLAPQLGEPALKAEYDALSAAWRAIVEARPAMPTLLRPAESLAWRALLGWADPVPARIILDDADERQELIGQMANLPVTLPNPEYHGGPMPLFDSEIEETLAGLAEPRVELEGGGWLMIEPTSALTAIDVNSGGQYETAPDILATTVNELAAAEIARQLRLRDIGGLIAVDFIGTPERGKAKDLLKVLDKGIAGDVVPVRRTNLSEFGMVELSRQKTGPSVAAQLTREPATTALRLLRAAQRETGPGRSLIVQAPQSVLDWIAANGLSDPLARRLGRRVELRPGETGVWLS